MKVFHPYLYHENGIKNNPYILVYNRMSYKNAKIYKILNNATDDVYIGSTTQPLSKRMVDHRASCKSDKSFHLQLHNKMNELGIENFYIELLEEYPCENVEQLRKREGERIREFATLNRYVAGRDEQQYREDNKEQRAKTNKAWREKNHDGLLQKKKDDYQNNREHYLDMKKKYYIEKKDEINEKQKTKILCVCGVECRKSDIRRHERTKRHIEFLNQQEASY